MTLEAAIAERRKELQHAIRFYEDREWQELAVEYRVRLDEIQRLEVFAAAATMQMPEGEALAMAGDR